MKQEEDNLQAQIDILKKERQIITKIATPSGFYQYYFEQLKNFKSNIECFNKVNEMYFQFFGEYKYSYYDSFKQQFKKHLKK